MSESIEQIIQNFTFIRPLWLWGILPVLVVYLLKLKFGKQQNVWQQLLPHHLYQKLVISKGIGKPNRYIHTAMLAWMLSMLAISGPSWEKLPQAVYQTQAGKVILMDMSLSLRATDLQPNRLTRARFKAIDLINQLEEGETGLVAYSGDAFVISPLTDDAATLSNLIPSLSPEIMPTKGSSPLAGLKRAAELLSSAGYKSGDIYWLTDGISYADIDGIRDFITKSQFKVSALLVGTEEGAPIQLTDGKLLKDATGSIVVPSVRADYFNRAMSGTSANFSLFASDNSDIAQIKRKIDFEQQQQAKQVEDSTGDSYKDMGPYIVLLLLPIAAYAFRKGVMMLAAVSVFTSFTMLPSPPAHAIQQANTQVPPNTTELDSQDAASMTDNIISGVFKNADQRGKDAFDAGQYDKAKTLFEDPQWQAASAYKKGDFETAATLYQELEGIDNIYNLANSLAKSMQLKEALTAYDKVLESQPKHENALRNKAIVEQLLEQQENQQQDEQEDSDQQNDENQDSQDQQQSDENQSSESDSDEQQSDGEPSEESSESESESDDSSDSEQQNNSDQQESQQQDDRDLKDQAQENADQQQDQQPETGESEQNENPEQEQQMPRQEQEGEEEPQQQAISNAEFNPENLSPEEQEEMQRLQMILNKVPDDPAYLLQRKMLLEAHKRKQTPAPPTQENW